MSAIAQRSWVRQCQASYQPKERKWARPGDLARALDPTTRDSLPLQVIDRELVKLTDHEVPADALAIYCPPQEGKSTRVSRWFPLWLLAHNPALRIAIVSYEKDMSVRWGRQILRDLRQADRRLLDVTVMADSSAAGRWDTPQGGGVYCVGVGGALTGRPVDVLVVDDPVKGREEAESEVLRERAWEWWENVAITRLAPGGVVCLMLTRWHEDDLAGRIMSRPSPLRWRLLSMPAISEGPGDPLMRPEGEEFPSVRGRAPGYFRNLQANITPYVFTSVYMQKPTAAVGNFFRRASFRYWRPVLGVPDPGLVLARRSAAGAWIELEGRRVNLSDPAVWRFATCDLAASEKTSADWTVVSVWAIDRQGDLILLDRSRARVEMANHFEMAAPLRIKWRYDVLYVPHEYWSKTLVLDARAAGVPVTEVITDGDKVTRAIPAASRTHAGRVWFPAEAPWLADWENELASFPRGTFDDQVEHVQRRRAGGIGPLDRAPSAVPSCAAGARAGADRRRLQCRHGKRAYRAGSYDDEVGLTGKLSRAYG